MRVKVGNAAITAGYTPLALAVKVWPWDTRWDASPEAQIGGCGLGAKMWPLVRCKNDEGCVPLVAVEGANHRAHRCCLTGGTDAAPV
jgi:hypothetical protein